MVVFLFVIMLLGIGSGETELRKKTAAKFLKIRRGLNLVLIAALLTELFLTIVVLQKAPMEPMSPGTVEAIGFALFNQYLLPFELVSGVLLVGIFGVVTLSQKELNS